MTCSRYGCDKPIHSKGLCQPHYRQAQRRERGLQKPGPKPDPSKPFSRYNDETSHHNKRIKCAAGHPFDGVDTSGKQTCSICREEKRKTHCPQGHEKNSINTSPSGNCRICARDNQRRYRPLNKYGITPEKMTELLDAQDNSCAICHIKFGTGAQRPEVDHDHSCCPGQVTCGKCIRKILCNNCNGMIGKARDSISILRSAVYYLESHSTEDLFGEHYGRS